MDEKKIKEVVRENYGKIAATSSSCCGPSSCCGSSEGVAEKSGKNIGYTKEEMDSVPEGANLGLGCGNPLALTTIKEGEVVVDLGSGAGFDCFLASGRVGNSGRVIGVDMTPEMVQKARENAEKQGYQNVEFLQGEIENLPIEDAMADLVISNCVINLSPDKSRVFREVHRVLKPGGRMMISDIVLTKPLPTAIQNSLEALVGCVAGAMVREDYLQTIREVGFEKVEVMAETPYSIEYFAQDPTYQRLIMEGGFSAEELMDTARSVVSLKVGAWK